MLLSYLYLGSVICVKETDAKQTLFSAVLTVYTVGQASSLADVQSGGIKGGRRS